MRTTLTLDDDVAALIRRLTRSRGVRPRDLINDALRLGLQRMESPRPRSGKYRTRVHDGGRCLLPSLDCISEVLAIVEGDHYK